MKSSSRRFRAVDILLILMVILPMLFEAAWCVLLQGIRLKPAFVFGILGAAICVLLMAQGLYEGGFFRVTLSAIMYPIAALFLVIIVWGYFPYRLFGFVALAAVVVLRILFFGPIVQLFRGEWLELLRSLPGICNSAALWFLFGGIRATRINRE